MSQRFPTFRSVVLDTTDARGLAEFYRKLLGFSYLPGDEPPPDDEPDPHGQDWLVLLDPPGTLRLAFQQVADLPPSTWPRSDVPQQLHLDFAVASIEALAAHHERAVSLGARELEDRSDDSTEPLHVYADPAGHPFCIFVVPPYTLD